MPPHQAAEEVEQRDESDGERSALRSGGEEERVDFAAIGPQVIDHEAVRCGTGVHPAQRREPVRVLDVVQFEQHPGEKRA